MAVGSRDVSKAEAMLARWGLTGKATAHSSYAAVLDDPRVQAVYIPLPTTMHVEWVTAAAQKGKHVLLEKPIAVSPEDTDAMVAACAQYGVVLMDGTMWMHNPRTKMMKEVLDSGKLGALRTVESAFCFAAPDGFESNIRLKRDCDPLGALGDVGWYCIRAILWAFNYEEPEAIVAAPGSEHNSEGVPLHMGATLLFSGGRRAHFDCGFDRALTQRFEICGTEGAITVDDFVIPHAEEQCSYILSTEHGFKDYDTWDATKRTTFTAMLQVPQEVHMWEAFAECIRKVQAGGSDAQHWARIAALTQKVVCAVERSAKDGCAAVKI